MRIPDRRVMDGAPVHIEQQLQEALAPLDLLSLRRSYLAQNEFIFLAHFLPAAVTDHILCEVERVRPDVHRNYIPVHKKGGSVGYYTLRRKAPAILALYRSPFLLTFLSRLVNMPLLPCPDDDPHACALYWYTEPGDHIGYHYDTSYYKGARYTVLVGLVERSVQCRLVAQLYKGDQQREPQELRIPMDPGSLVVFNGDKLWHAVTPLGSGEERIVLALQYVTNQEMGPVQRLVSNLKDAFAYFGLAALVRRKVALDREQHESRP